MPHRRARTRLLGLILRVLGPALEILCVVALLRWRGQGRQVLGLPLESLLFAGFAFGLVCVFLGLWLSLSSPRSARPRFDLDLGPEPEPDAGHRLN